MTDRRKHRHVQDYRRKVHLLTAYSGAPMTAVADWLDGCPIEQPEKIAEAARVLGVEPMPPRGPRKR